MYDDNASLSASIISVDLIEAYRRSDEKPETWTMSNAELALRRYRQFLLLASKYKHLRHAPTKDIDVMWHLHMLHPRAYASDCIKIFGEIFDHNGGFGKGEGELPKLQAIFHQTAQLWQAEYNEPYLLGGKETDELKKCWHDCEGRCWHACSNN